MWSVGIIMAELLLGKVPCMGKSELDQASKIWELVGTPNEENWPTVKKDTKIGQVGTPYSLKREHKLCCLTACKPDCFVVTGCRSRPHGWLHIAWWQHFCLGA